MTSEQAILTCYRSLFVPYWQCLLRMQRAMSERGLAEALGGSSISFDRARVGQELHNDQYEEVRPKNGSRTYIQFIRREKPFDRNARRTSATDSKPPKARR